MQEQLKFLLDHLHAIYPLSEGLRAHLQSIIKHGKFRRNDFLLKQGQVNTEMHFIIKGLLRCYYKLEFDEKEVSAWFMKEGDIIVSIDSFYDQLPGYEYIQALENTETFYISFEELEDIYQRFPEFNFIGRKLTTRYLILWNKQFYNMRALPATERYKLLVKNHQDLFQRVPAKYLASFLDMTEVTFSRTRGL